MIVCMFQGLEFPPGLRLQGSSRYGRIEPSYTPITSPPVPFLMRIPLIFQANGKISARRLLVLYVNARGRCVIASDLAP